MLIERAEAASAIPRRVFFLHSHNGVMPSAWRMSFENGRLGIGGSFAPLDRFAQVVNAIEGMRYVPMGGMTGHVAGGPTFMTNTRMNPFNQNDANTRSQGPSIDFFIAQKLAAQLNLGADMRALLLSMTTGDQWGGGEYLTYESARNPRKSIGDPSVAFARAFNRASNGAPPLGHGAPSTGGQSDAQARSRALREKRALVDFLKRDFDEIRSQLSSAERAKMDDHLQAVLEIEKTLDETTTPANGSPSTGFEASKCPDPKASLEPQPNRFRTFARIAVEAMACGQTQVATIRIAGGNGLDNGRHHTFHHGEGSNPEGSHNAVTAWQAGEVAWLVQQLSERKEAGGTRSMLDNTMIVWSNEIGIGGAGEHGPNKLPMIVIGSCGGYCKTNQLIRTINRSHSQVLVSAAKAMGVGDGLNGFGDMAGCEPGELMEMKA
jgi:hypothetical protein